MVMFRGRQQTSNITAWRSVKTIVGIVIATIVSVLWLSGAVGSATPLTSPNYIFTEQSLGGIGQTDTTSTSYQGASSAGILGFGSSADSSFQIKTGNTTTHDPALEFGVDNTNAAFGSFSPTAPTEATTTFQVSNYTSYGYVVQIFGNPPSNGSHTITAMSSLGSSVAGEEQFGINLVANTSPSTFGANPNLGQFGYGSAVGNYAVPNEFIYNSGDTIVAATESSGVTLYTISYIVNVSSITPGGQYGGAQTIICTGTY